MISVFSMVTPVVISRFQRVTTTNLKPTTNIEEILSWAEWAEVWAVAVWVVEWAVAEVWAAACKPVQPSH